ncbi:MAG: UDP-N-acetylglucosamine 2-epimerase [Bacteroidales bacterium]|nr:UDP-N-acetylglucosamine 2-epimerase [Bacteroidales bacterium]
MMQILKLAGTDKDKIVFKINLLLSNKKEYERMSKAHNSYGDGKACLRINDYFL